MASSGTPTINKELLVHAWYTSPCASACKARVVPQPLQYQPVNPYSGHLGKYTLLTESLARSTANPAIAGTPKYSPVSKCPPGRRVWVRTFKRIDPGYICEAMPLRTMIPM